MSLPLFFFALDVANVVCIVLLAARVLSAHPRLPSARLIALIAFDSICYVVLARDDYRYWIPPPLRIDVGAWSSVLNFARNLTPGLFMILCFTLFADRGRFPRWLLGLFFVEMVLELAARRLIPAATPFAGVATQIVPSLLQTLFVGFALYWTVADWRADLVERRRRVRALVVVVIGLDIIASSLLLRVLIDPNSIANYDAHLALMVINLLVTALVLVRFKPEDLAGSPGPLPAPAPPPVLPEMAGALARLTALLEDERVYRRPSLTPRELAGLVGLPEYRLRKLINEHLGHQNFNAFLHEYRIKEACRQLRDPRLRRTPILTIALSVGYQSVNTFNRGFRDVMDMTPSAYRAQEAAGKVPPETE